MAGTATIQVYGALNDFVESKNTNVTYDFNGRPSLKDAIEAIGIPHPEVEEILLNGKVANFDDPLKNGDHLEVFDRYKAENPILSNRIGPKKFVLDIHLGKLARLLRLLGFNTLYENDLDDDEIIKIALEDQRIILTRDLGILKNNKVKRGYWLRSQDSEIQLEEVLTYFDLKNKVKPFTRCMICNGLVKEVEKSKIKNQLEPLTKENFNEFFQCQQCEQVYWKGSHYQRMKGLIEKIS